MSDDHGYHHGPHDWSHGAPHNSWAPIVISIGSGVFLFFFAKAFTMNEGMNGYIYDSAPLPLAIAGLAAVPWIYHTPYGVLIGLGWLAVGYALWTDSTPG